MIRTVFVDAACLVSLINPRDQMHQNAIEALSMIEGAELMTTDAVLTEVLNYYAERGDYFRREALSIVKNLMTREDFNLIYHGKYLFHMALERFEDRQDKGYSLTDCMSMIVMESDGVQDILTSDKHFKQAGFNILMPHK
jgi:uncharacterized protein